MTDMLAVIDRLTAEHEELLPRVNWLADLALAGDPSVPAEIDALAEVLQVPLDGHISLEDDVLFPAYAGATGEQGIVQVFFDEHREIQKLRDELLALRRGPSDARALAAAFLRLSDVLTDHMAREEAMLFPAARELIVTTSG
jgi:iron-sulfur cluster repair protein YtfE (RIC family)